MEFIMSLLNSVNLDYIFGTLIVIGLLASKIWLLPYLNKMGINKKYYNLIQEALLLGGYAFRADKVGKIISIAMEIVCALDTLNDLDNTQKHTQAVGELAEKLFAKLDIQLNKDTLDRLVRIAVAFMGEK